MGLACWMWAAKGLVFTSGCRYIRSCLYSVGMRKLVNMRLDVGLLARVDAVAGVRGRTRFVVRALELALADGLGSSSVPSVGKDPVGAEGSSVPAAPVVSRRAPSLRDTWSR